jgi:hypothetical protein
MFFAALNRLERRMSELPILLLKKRELAQA